MASPGQLHLVFNLWHLEQVGLLPSPDTLKLIDVQWEVQTENLW